MYLVWVWGPIGWYLIDRVKTRSDAINRIEELKEDWEDATFTKIGWWFKSVIPVDKY